MKVNLKSNGKELGYVGTNIRGQQIELYGNKEGVGPMESVLMAAAACSAIDIELILKKMKQDYTEIEVEVEAERATDETPAVFKKIHLHYIVSGDVKARLENTALRHEERHPKHRVTLTLYIQDLPEGETKSELPIQRQMREKFTALSSRS